MINSLIGAVIKTAVIFVLASQPAFGINGAALGIVTGFMLVTLLHFVTILKVIPLTIYIRDYFKITVVILISGYLGHYSFENLLTEQSLILRLLFSIILTCIIYFIFSALLKIVHRSDLTKIPFIKKIII
jgi:stage V sporulation protein B